MPSAKQILKNKLSQLKEKIANDKDPTTPEEYEKLTEKLQSLIQKPSK